MGEPTQSDTHVDAVMGAVHPFVPLDEDSRMCAKCGLTQSQHDAIQKCLGPMVGQPTPSSAPFPTADPFQACPTCGGSGTLAASESQQNNNAATPPDQRSQNMSPEDDATDPNLQAGNGQLATNPFPFMSLVPTSTPPGLFHRPGPNPTGPPNATKSASFGFPPQQPPVGSQSGEVGEWPSTRDFNFVPAGQSLNPQHVQPAAQDLPRDPMGNVRQDGPVFGPSNPGMPPQTQMPDSSHMGSPTQPAPPHGQPIHNFNQCPQCGVGVTGTEFNCPNPWCGHDLANDPTASYDQWQNVAPPYNGS